MPSRNTYPKQPHDSYKIVWLDENIFRYDLLANGTLVGWDIIVFNTDDEDEDTQTYVTSYWPNGRVHFKGQGTKDYRWIGLYEEWDENGEGYVTRTYVDGLEVVQA